MKIRKLSVVAAAAILTGCASDAHIYKAGLFGQNVSGNEVSVSVSNVWSTADARGLADQWCAKYGRVSKPLNKEGYIANFECVKP